jgi:putative ABC transport system permease protein
MLTDLRQALRLLRRHPGFSAVACLTLALGIGANAAVFSVVDAALFRPLPYRDAERLVTVYRLARTPDGHNVPILIRGDQVSYIRDAATVFDRVEVFSQPKPMALRAGLDQSPWVGGIGVGLTALLGVTPQLGRAFSAEDLAARDTVVLSDGYWRRAFHADRNVIGRVVPFVEGDYRVIGVMPPSFRYFAGANVDLWVAIGDREGDDLAAHLRPGVTVPQARRELTELSRQVSGKPLEWLVERAGSNRIEGAPRRMLLSLMAAVGFVLLIACANVANLVLARTLARQGEIGVRTALGATRWQIVRQFLVEGLVLGTLGGLAAVTIGSWAIRAIPAIVPGKLTYWLLAASLPELDWRVLAVAVASALVAGACCGLVSAIRASRRQPLAGRFAGVGRVTGFTPYDRVLRNAFQTLQIALTLVLLSGAGVYVGSFIRMATMPRGFESRNLWYVSLTSPGGGVWTVDRQAAYIDQLTSRVSRLPGVREVAFGQSPVSGARNTTVFTPEGDPARASATVTQWYFVSDNYFRAAGIPILEGRAFGSADRPDTPEVIIISENAARRLWPQQSAIGRRFSAARVNYTVVGVVPHLKTFDVAADGFEMFRAASQATYIPSFVVRVTEEAPLLADAIRAEVRAIDPVVKLQRLGTVDNLVAEFDPLGSARLYATLLGVMAAIGLLTATIGLYGVIAYSVVQRTREIGVRMALGADGGRVKRLVVREALVPVIAGVATGLVAAMWLSRFIASQVFQISPRDPAMLAGIVLLLVMVCGIAVALPVRRATRVDPVEALRAE